MKRLIIPVLSIITIAISILNFALYDVSKAAIVFCNEGSYAHEWATEHNATVELIAESDEHIFSVSLENFKYNFDGNTAVIVEYNGKSETIAIPYFIEGRVVYKVEQDAFDNASNLKSIYVPNSVQEFEATDLENITVFCEKDSATWIVLEEAQKVAEEEYNSKMENVQEGEEELVMAVTTQFEELLDSDFVNFSSSYIPFSYDTENGKINLSRYLEDTDFVVVPTHIDGKEVSEISFPVLEAGITTIVIPDTVTKINSDICTNRYDARFFVGMGILWLGYLIAIGTSIIAFKNNDTLNKKFLGVPFIFSGRKYYILLTIIGVLAIWLFFNIWLYLIVTFIILAFAVSEIISVFVAKEAISKTEEKVKVKTSFIRLLTADSLTLMQNAKNEQYKNIAKKVYEAVRYSDPMSAEGLLKVEDKIATKFDDFSEAIKTENENAIVLADEILGLIKERNNKCKVLK